MSNQDIILKFLSLFLLIAINAFFVTAEFAIVSVRRSRISQLVESGDLAAKTVQSLQRSLEKLLSTTQLGITLSSLALGWIGENTMAVFVSQLIKQLPLSNNLITPISHSFAVPIAFFLIAYFQIVLGELLPKSLALIYSEKIARFLAPPSLAIASVFNPFIWILNQSTRCLLRLFGVEYTKHGLYNRVTSEELRLIITTERESTGLEAAERKLLENVFEFGDVLAVEVMVPRTSLVAIDYNATFQDLIQEVGKTQHTCYPVTGESLDDIRGIIDFKDLAIPWSLGELQKDTPIKHWVKPVRFVSESTISSELLKLMQRSHLKMIMVVDEFGGTSGLVTLQDLIREIIGDETQNSHSATIPVQMIDEQTFLVEAQTNLEELNELLDLDLPYSDEYQTLSGFLIYQWQKIPKQGETFTYNNLDLTVVKATGPRLHEIQICRHDHLDLKTEESIESNVLEIEAILLEDLVNEPDINDYNLESESPESEQQN